MLKAVKAKWNNKKTLEQIKWVEERYNILFRTTRKRKQKLTGIINFESAGNLRSTATNLQGASAELGTQSFLQQTAQQPGQSLSHQELFVLQDVRNQRYQPIHGLQYQPEIEQRHNNN